MNKLKNILVGVDFSDRSRAALHHAVRMARWNGAQLHTFQGLQIEPFDGPPPAGFSFEEMRSRTVDLAHEELGSWVREADAPPETLMQVCVGPPVDTMLELAQEISADIIVLGASGQPEAPRVGTFSSIILRAAPVKVMLVRPEHPLPFSKVVACIDFGDSAREVVSQAVQVAAQDGGEVHFLHVFQSPWQSWLHWLQRSPLIAAVPAVADQLSAGRRARLAEFVHVPDKISAQLRVREAETHARGIIEHVREIDADLVILGRRATSDPKFALRGTTVAQLLRDLPCSVLAVEQPRAESAEPDPR